MLCVAMLCVAVVGVAVVGVPARQSERCPWTGKNAAVGAALRFSLALRI